MFFSKDSACQILDLEHRCYKTDPKCPHDIDEGNFYTQAGFIGSIAAIPIVVLFVLCVLTYIHIRKRRRQEKAKKTGTCKLMSIINSVCK